MGIVAVLLNGPRGPERREGDCVGSAVASRELQAGIGWHRVMRHELGIDGDGDDADDVRNWNFTHSIVS